MKYVNITGDIRRAVLAIFLATGMIFSMAPQLAAAQFAPVLIYADNATEIRVAPLVQGGLPDLQTALVLTASAACQTDPSEPPFLLSLQDTGDFLAVWRNLATDECCYSRFVPDGQGGFVEDFKGEWPGGAKSIVDGPGANLWNGKAAGDLTGDGKEDLVLRRAYYPSGGSGVTFEYKVATGRNDGGFDFGASPITYVTGGYRGGYLVEDIDQNGHRDFVYFSLANGGAVSVDCYMLEGNGDGTFADIAYKKLLFTSGSGRGFVTTPLADFDSDGITDAFMGPDDDVSDEGQAYIAFGTGGGNFGPLQESIDFVPNDEGPSSDSFAAYVTAQDVDLDGNVDIFAKECNRRTKTMVGSVWWGDGNGGFSPIRDVLFTVASQDQPMLDWLYSQEISPSTEKVVMDMDLSTTNYSSPSDIEPEIEIREGDEIWVAAVALDVEDLDTYQVEIEYDPERLELLDFAEDGPGGEPENILKKNGGVTTGIVGTETAPGRLNLSNTLAGADCEQAPEGNGVLAALKFRILESDSAEYLDLVPGNVFFVDCNDQNKEITDLRNGTFILPGSCPADFNGDGKVDFIDLAMLADHWMTEKGDPVWSVRYDLNDDRTVNYLDLAIFGDYWLTQC